MSKKYWEIVGYDGSKEIYRNRVQHGCFTENQIRSLLKTLAAKEGLTYNEIVGAYAKRRTNISNSLLDVHKNFCPPQYMCGTNPHFIARIVNDN